MRQHFSTVISWDGVEVEFAFIFRYPEACRACSQFPLLVSSLCRGMSNRRKSNVSYHT
jgi:hypothetical protein